MPSQNVNCRSFNYVSVPQRAGKTRSKASLNDIQRAPTADAVPAKEHSPEAILPQYSMMFQTDSTLAHITALPYSTRQQVAKTGLDGQGLSFDFDCAQEEVDRRSYFPTGLFASSLISDCVTCDESVAFPRQKLI